MNPETNKQVFSCFLKTLSPVHIGCDEVYEPTGFVLDESANQLVVFNSFAFINGLSAEDKNKFTDICSKGTISSILEVYKFLKNRSANGRRVDVCGDFVAHYEKTLSIPIGNEKKIQQELNRFYIPRTAFSPVDQRPYIPGSSVKGALRTAYLNLMEDQKKLGELKKRFKNFELEKELMKYKEIEGDPFRMVKVSDFRPVGDVQARIVYGVNEKKRVSEKAARGIPLIFEVIQPGAVFEGSISVETPAKSAPINEPVKLDSLLKGSSVFYEQEKNREDVELQAVGISSPFAWDNSAVLIRCGRHSGAESVTIAGHRSIKIMGKKGDKPKYLKRANTFWLSSDFRIHKHKKGLKPFGWVGIHELTEELKNDFLKKEQTFKKDYNFEQELQKAEAQKKRDLNRKAAQAVEKLAREAEAKRQAEEQRKAELEAMSPEEKDIALVNDSNIDEQQVFEIYGRIGNFSDDNKKKLAAALKAYWVTHGKWKGKQSKKQNQKVQKIKEILGVS